MSVRSPVSLADLALCFAALRPRDSETCRRVAEILGFAAVIREVQEQPVPIVSMQGTSRHTPVVPDSTPTEEPASSSAEPELHSPEPRTDDIRSQPIES